MIRLNTLSLLLLSMLSTQSMADKISIVSDEWLPYNGTPNSQEEGYGIEILREIFKPHGHTIDYMIVPWTRAIKATKAGKYNAVIGTTVGEAEDLILPKEEFGVGRTTFIKLKGLPYKINKIDDLAKYKISVIKDYDYGQYLKPWFSENPKNLQYVLSDNPMQTNIIKLQKKRTEIIIENENVFLYRTQKMGIADQFEIVETGKNIHTSDNLYIAFSPKNPKSAEYAAIFSRGIRQLSTSGRLQEILAKYGLRLWR